ncbi:hypothetical protein D3C76_852060 [compost metagenome]
MAFADFHARCIGRDQCQADTQLHAVTQQVVRVVGLECEPQQGGDGPQGDVALLPVQAQADHGFTLPLPSADYAGIWHGARVGPGHWASEGKAGDFFAPGQARQIVISLFFGAVVQQQFGRPQRVGHHHG